MTRTFLETLLFICLALGSVSVAFADYYKYTDSNGAVNITNKPDSIPAKYRSHLKVIKDETLSKKDQGAPKPQQAEPVPEEAALPKEAAAPAPAPAPQGKFAELSASYSWFKPLVYLAAVFAAFLIVVKIAAMVPSAQLSKLIYLSFFIGVFVFLYQAYVTHVVEDSLAVKEKAVNMMKKSTQREMPLPDEAPAAEKK